MKCTDQGFIGRKSAWALVLACAIALAGCGGGGGSPGTTSGTGSGSTGTGGTGGSTAPVATAGVTVSMINSNGQATNALTASSPLTVKATVKDKDGKVVPNALVTFATDATLAVFTPSSGVALSDATGVASIAMRPFSLAAGGAATVSATSIVAGATVVGQANYSVGATALTMSPIRLADAAIPAYGSTTVAVDVLSSGARYTDQQLNVTFNSACVATGKATLAASVPTSGGTAQAVYRDLGCAGKDTITASVQGAPDPAVASLTIAAPAAASVQFSSALPSDKSIVIQGKGGISRTETATLKFRVFDIFNNPLAGQVVTFSTTSPDVTINKGQDSTDLMGEVITTVNSGTKPATFRVKATLANGMSTLSDSIVVTTGLPTQLAFSLSVSDANIEGWSYDSGPTVPATHINVLLADQYGNPVPDGAPVIFQTNLGAVGSSSKGACNTVNGGCSVDFRTQDPRSHAPNFPPTPCNKNGAGGPGFDDSTRVGLATICASSTDGDTVLFKKTAIFFSNSVAQNVYLDGSASPIAGGVVTDLGTVGATDSKVFSLLISDSNFNPLPVGTKVEIATINNGTAVGVAPNQVQNVFPHSPAGDDQTGNVISGNQGSYHTITIGSAQPKPPASCQTALLSTFSINITTPKGTITAYPFKVTFSCP